MTHVEQLVPAGPFSLRAAAEFGFGPNEGRPPPFAEEMRLAFPADSGRGHVGAVLRQARSDTPSGAPGGPVSVELQLRGDVDAAAALAQVARTVSLDHDATGFAALSDPIIQALQRAHPGQRPVLFPSPYEAAAWSVLSARRPARQGAQVRAALGAEFGETFELAGETLSAFPVPERLAEIPDGFPALGATKIERLRGVAAAALAGELDVARIHAVGPEQAYADVQRIPGIGPFYAMLVVLRASGFADAWLPMREHRGADHAARYYGLESELNVASFAELAERWRPFRTWALVLIRLAGERGTTL